MRPARWGTAPKPERAQQALLERQQPWALLSPQQTLRERQQQRAMAQAAMLALRERPLLGAMVPQQQPWQPGDAAPPVPPCMAGGEQEREAAPIALGVGP